MGVDQIPVIDLSKVSQDISIKEWQNMCKRVREACETYGCFVFFDDKISMKLREETFGLIRHVFDFPLETKKKNVNSTPYHSYAGGYAAAPLYESLGIEDVLNYDSLNDFIHLFWPHGHRQFNDTISSMMKLVDETHYMILKMIAESYGLKYEDMDKFNMECKTLLRMMKYTAPPNEEYTNGLNGHTDKLLSTILFEDQVSGLEFEIEPNQWTKLASPPGSFIFLVGDPLMAWSNGRLRATSHRVMMSGNKDRYSLATFLVPGEGVLIKPPPEFVDKNHPRILKDFNLVDFLKFTLTQEGLATESHKQLFAFDMINK